MKRHLPLLLLLLGALVFPAPAQAAPCSGSTGVTVVVQYDASHTQVGCAPGDPGSGYDALSAAGFNVLPAQGSGAGAICKINSYPTDANCGAMPPANAYWAYFHARPGGSWSYSTEGGGTYDPAPGSVEGWRFNRGDGVEKRPPSIAPPAAATTPTPHPTKHPAKHPTGKATPQTFEEPGPVTTDAATHTSGSTSWIWGVVLIALVAAVGGGVALRRRRG
ncbi:MAG: hypothetical protein ACJ72E_15540 [Marmoricola sp.]